MKWKKESKFFVYFFLKKVRKEKILIPDSEATFFCPFG